jgi:flagellar motor protein MotB
MDRAACACPFSSTELEPKMNLNRTILARSVAFAALALSLGGFTGCVGQAEQKRLQTAFDQARQQLAEDENDLETLRKKNADLEAQIAEMEKNGGDVDALKKDRDALMAQLAELKDKYDKLLSMAGTAPALPPDIDSALRDLAAKYPDLLEYDSATGRVRFKSDLTFDLGSTEVKPRAKEALGQFAGIINSPEIAKNELRVIGNTDDVPIRGTRGSINPTNRILSTNRANSVISVLTADGVSDLRLQAAGWGEFRPIVQNAPGKHGAEQNRRVDVYILPTTVPDGLTISTPGSSLPPRMHRKARPVTPTAPAAPSTPAGSTDSTVPLPKG